MVATMFAEYCAIPFEIEPVRIHMPDGTSHLSPPLAARQTVASSSYINSATGLELSREEQCHLLTRMSLFAKPSASNETELDVSVPATRPDILHECDIMEDAAIAYGFNNLPKSMPTTNTVAKALPVNKLADLIRKECAMAGWTEALPLILVSQLIRLPFLKLTGSALTMKTSSSSTESMTVPPPYRFSIQQQSSSRSFDPPFFPVCSKLFVKTRLFRFH
jgi:phenylalanyl-tRNA synthetase beta subunit